ncbi:hypothetical protein MKW94_022946 [Papaver nudicaule]|uniref:PB1 domain-containing protein n=1 Tax=Papaver nudicaule TaxID=74823 RepID=A0AA41V3Y3_PAPNU|nr:hypothetical protein [Papaver nudicaule]
MDNSYSSYADSGDSSPRSREIDCENQLWEDPSSTTTTAAAANYKVKFMVSYNGKIQPRPHDNQLTYVGGDTKILSAERNSKFVTVMNKLLGMCTFDTVNVKYQLPGEDLDALVSVTNDEDLEHMMIEYDRLNRSSPKPARLRLFLFPVKSTPSSLASSAKADGGGCTKTNQQWLDDALRSVHIQQQQAVMIDSAATSPPSNPDLSNPDFLFGLDNNNNNTPVKHDLVQEQQQMIQEQQLQIQDHNREDHRILVGEHAEIQRQIQELQKLQISNQEQQQQTLTRAFAGDYYVHKVPENTIPAVSMPLTSLPPVSPPSVPVAAPAAAAAGGYWQERHVAPPPVTGADHQVYLIPTPTGYYQAQAPPPQSVMQVPGQGYYAPPPPPVYREQPVYGVPPPQQQQQQQVQPRIVQLADGSYAQVGYDNAGRQVYYAAPKPPSPAGVMPAAYQTMANGGIMGGGAAMDLRPQQLQQQQQQQANLASNPEVKLPNLKPAQAAAI